MGRLWQKSSHNHLHRVEEIWLVNQELGKYGASWLEYLTLVNLFRMAMGLIFVKKDTLQRSEAAQKAIGFVTTLFHWIAALERR